MTGSEAKGTAAISPHGTSTIGRGAFVFTGFLTLVTAGLAASVAGLGGLPEEISWPTAALFFVLIALGMRPVVRFRYREQVESLNLFEAVLAPTIFAFHGLIVMGLVAGAVALTNVLRRNRPIRTFFNIVQMTGAAGAGSIVFGALRDDPLLSTRNFTALVIAVLTATTVNQLAFTYMIHLADGEPIRRIFTGLTPGIIPGWVLGSIFNTSFGLLFVVLYRVTPAALVFVVLPIFALQYAYREHATSLADRDRMTGLHRATRALAAPVDPNAAIAGFLEEVRDCFRAEAVDLVLIQGRVRTVHRFHEGRVSSYTGRVHSSDEPTLASALLKSDDAVWAAVDDADRAFPPLLRREGWRNCIAAPIRQGEHVIGSLCAYNRVGLERADPGELAVMEALAAEVAGTIQTGALVHAVLEERRKLSEIVNYTSDCGLALAPDGTVLMWNPGLERISGYRSAEIVGRTLPEGMSPRDTQGGLVPLERWADDDTELPSDVQIVAGTGEVRWLSCSYTRVPRSDGQAAMLIVVARDVTELREAEQLKEDFAGTVSHELRRPLTPIKGWAATLLRMGDQLGEAERRRAVESILVQADRLERIIINLLEVSKIQRGTEERRKAVTDLKSLSRRIVEEFQVAHPDRIIRFEAQIPACRVVGEELWIEQIIDNLVQNAIKYAPVEEPIDVKITKAAGFIELAVVDRGPGIPPEEIDRIFHRFHRLGDTMTRGRGGAGLGLYIARQLAQGIGGTLIVQSTPGEGATFTLKLQEAIGLSAVG